MQLVASRTAQEYNRRKSRHGAFWADRYHATAVQEDDHLARCMTYIDLNMVRAGAAQHPDDWDVTGYSEIQRPWKRKGVIDFDALSALLGTASTDQLARRMRRAAEAGIGKTSRDAAWSESVGIGDEAFLKDLEKQLGARGIFKKLRKL
jgi:putative transposase